MMMTLLREIFHKDESNVGQTPFSKFGKPCTPPPTKETLSRTCRL